jgi:hypothetical protein
VETADIVIIGSGSLAHGIVYALSQVGFVPDCNHRPLGKEGLPDGANRERTRGELWYTPVLLFRWDSRIQGSSLFASASFSQAEGHASGSLLAVALGEFPGPKRLDKVSCERRIRDHFTATVEHCR